ncbi:cytochrome P450 [Halenospora varia]|nr:cytochrome P450 [Halenospora varia]
MDILSSYVSTHSKLLGLFALILVIFYRQWNSNSVYKHFQRCGGGILGLTPIHEVVYNGYYNVIKKTQKPFAVRWWAHDFLIMPPKYLKDVRGAAAGHLSFFDNISHALHLHTSVGDLYTANSAQRMIDVVKKGLNPQLSQLTPTLVEEIEYSIETQLGSSIEWQEVKAMEFFAQVSHRTATRVLIEETLCRDETFIRLSMSLLESIFVTGLIIVKLPLGPLRGLLAWPISSLHRWKLRCCMHVLLPVVRKRVEESRSGAESKRLDAIQWTLDLFPETAENTDYDRFMKELLHNLWAGSSAPGGMMTEIIFQLLLHPEDLKALQKEASEAFRQYGWSEKMLINLHLLDSFIRETNRLFPTGSITCVRTVLGRPFQFSDGLTLPVGSQFGFPAKAIQGDYEGFKSPSEFVGFRFAGQNSDEIGVAENDKRWGASSVDTSNLAWGYGNHVCPGRFFAVRMMKLVIAKLILDYEMKWDREGHDRPPPINVEGQFVPNMKQKISLRRRMASGHIC